MNPTQFMDLVEAPPSTARTFTGDGYLTAPATLARAGVFRYLASELGLKDRKPNDVVMVFRSPETLDAALDTFESQTITLDHKWTTAANWKDNAIGDVRDVEIQGDSMVGTLIVRDAAAIKAIQKGTSQLSNGYLAKLLHRPGKHQGQDYEFEQTDLHGNHVAIVPKARNGPDCRISDSDPTYSSEENTMITRSFDGLSVTLENELSGQVFDRVVRELGDAKTQITTLKAIVPKVKLGDKEMDSTEVATLVAAKDAEIKTLKDGQQTPEQIHALVVSRSNAITSARELVTDLAIDDKDTAHDIRRKALDALTPKDETAKAMLDAALGTVKLADAQPAVVEVAFATIAAGLKRAKDARKVTDSRKQVSNLATITDSTGNEKDPRQAYADQLTQAWKGPQPTSKTEVN